MILYTSTTENRVSFLFLRSFVFFFKIHLVSHLYVRNSINIKNDRTHETILDDAFVSFFFFFFVFARQKISNRKRNSEGERKVKEENFFILFYVEIQTITSRV